MINQMTMEGRLVEPPKIFSMKNGGQVCEIQLLNNRFVGIGESRKRSECLVTGVAFGKLAEFAKSLNTGDQIIGTGSLDYQTWDKNGQTQSSHKFMIAEMVVCKEKVKPTHREHWDWSPKI